ncbi:MAG: CPXCG motif-containing cysteine-rich protein [Gammaproteobacteria bacterium]|nr:CPXCG motif-containing cysteine-rich protein [Gammaproteobacteria bacterium]
MSESIQVPCPFCWQANDIWFDPEEVGNVIVQDCSTCCQPIDVKLSIDHLDQLVAVADHPDD